MFASKTPRDLSHDPLAHVWYSPSGMFSGRSSGPYVRLEGDAPHWTSREEPRPEYDHVQHNEPSPILAAFRAYAEKHGMDASERANLARAWLQAPGFYERNLVTARMIKTGISQHAHAVLRRYVAFAEQETHA